MKYHEGISGVHLYSDGLEFPVALYEKSEKDRIKIKYLDISVQSTETLITWCISHDIEYDVIYPLKRSTPIRHPIRHIHYLKLKHKYSFA